MRIYDISVSISSDMPTYPGDPKVTLTPMLEIAKGDNANVSQLCMGDHTGTHLDPPVHFIPGGKTVDELDLDTLYGPAHVLDMTALQSAITASNLDRAGLPTGATRVLFKTHNSRLWSERTTFSPDFIAIAADGAQWIVDHGIQLVGIDYLSVEPYHSEEPRTHRTLLGAGIIIVEGLNLHEVKPGIYTLACLPLKIKNGDGGPCRAILVES